MRGVTRSILVSLLALLPIQGAGSGRPLVIAHRGGMALEPQNTMAAFRNARRLGADLILASVDAPEALLAYVPGVLWGGCI